MSQPQSDQKDVVLAMVTLNTPSLPTPAEILGKFEDLSGVTIDPESVNAKDEAMVFTLGKDHAAVSLMPAPIPWSNLEGPCATAWWWPEATERMKSHNSHVIVALVGDKGNPIHLRVMLTHLTASVLLHTDAAGVYWGDGTLVHEPKSFIEESKNASPDDPPLHLWIDFRVEQNEDGSCRLFTTGMKSFDQMEIEIPRSRRRPSEVLDFGHAVASYIITSNPNVEDGHTIGRSETEKIKIKHAPSMWDSKTTVLRLDF